MYLFFDIGVKNFCYFLCKITDEKLEIIDFQIIDLKNDTIKSVINLLDNLPRPEKYFVEIQNYRNTKCIKIETVIITYLSINKLKFKKVHSFRKIKMLKLNSSSYHIRKKSVIELGERLLPSSLMSDSLKEKVNGLSKRDDFFDCFLMALTELLGFAL